MSLLNPQNNMHESIDKSLICYDCSRPSDRRRDRHKGAAGGSPALPLSNRSRYWLILATSHSWNPNCKHNSILLYGPLEAGACGIIILCSFLFCKLFKSWPGLGRVLGLGLTFCSAKLWALVICLFGLLAISDTTVCGGALAVLQPWQGHCLPIPLPSWRR